MGLYLIKKVILYPEGRRDNFQDTIPQTYKVVMDSGEFFMWTKIFYLTYSGKRKQQKVINIFSGYFVPAWLKSNSCLDIYEHTRKSLQFHPSALL
jgi:hypothetical protein